jgi:glycoside/pentoside/hexuronide:cation symporter, GPH family
VAGAYLLGINGTIWAVTGLLAVFPLNWISPKMGKRNTLSISILLMCLAQLSKIVCYNPRYPYLIIIPTVLLSTGMLFFFTLGSSMVGDICDEDELKTGYRAEGSYYSIFWWLIKMGTAFASFIAGALIVLTAFDEIQVTKVDGIQGLIREMRSGIQSRGGDRAFGGNNAELLRKTKAQVAEALEEAKKYASYLAKEAAKQQEQSGQAVTEYHDRKRDRMRSALATVQATKARLEQLQLRLSDLGGTPQDSLVKAAAAEAIPLTLQTKLEKAKLNAWELMSHLESKSKDNKNSAAHYQEMIRNIVAVNNRIGSLNASSSPTVLDQELAGTQKDIMPLTKQRPYTLFMMRLVEIGLPVLLSAFSILFLLRYSLTEKRSQEIKELLKQRNEERSRVASNASGSATA